MTHFRVAPEDCSSGERALQPPNGLSWPPLLGLLRFVVQMVRARVVQRMPAALGEDAQGALSALIGVLLREVVDLRMDMQALRHEAQGTQTGMSTSEARFGLIRRSSATFPTHALRSWPIGRA